MDITGHVRVRAELGRIAKQAVHPQSFLFFGPRRLGKSLVAKEFALKLVGTAALPNGQHPDILLVGGPEKNGDDSLTEPVLSVEAVREAERFLSRFPESGANSVVIIDGADRLTRAAENALLKVLEEPNSSASIILVTHRPGKLLPTVRSRVFPVAFHLVPVDELRVAFQGQAESDLPDFFFSLGLPGLLHEAVVDPQAFQETKLFLRELFQLSRLSWAKRIKLAEALADNPVRLERLLEIWLIGLAREQGGQALRTKAYALFLEAVLETIDRCSEKEGSQRLLLEKLFTAA
jgi:DNA polymerase-3 subunit delta'